MGEPGGLPSMGSHSQTPLKRLSSSSSKMPGGSGRKESAYNAGDIRDARKIPWRRVWQPTPVFLPEESLGERIPVGYSP